jgi:bifunctional non-homologous end joining protein LigD
MSVLSDRPIRKKKPLGLKTKVRRDPLPDFIAPCLATLVTDVPQGAQWAHEIKFDGYRLQARLENGNAQLRTRTGLDWTHRFEALAKALSALKVSSALIDGEAIVEDQNGASSFAKLVDELKAGRSAQIVFFVFDLLYLNGVDVAKRPLLERKALLQKLFRTSKKDGPIRYSDHLIGDGKAMLEETCKLGLEGVICKRLDKPYRSGRHSDWLKAKCIQTDEFVIGGYLDSTAVRNAIGALALGYYDNKRFIYVGRVGTGFSRKTATDLWQALQPLRSGSSPFATALDSEQARSVIWVKPKAVAQIEYRSWTDAGLIRHASFKALRDDKPARQVGDPKTTPD